VIVPSQFTITTTRNGNVISTHTATTLDAAYLDILTDGLPPAMPLEEAWSLLGQVTAEGGTIELPSGILITVTPVNEEPLRA